MKRKIILCAFVLTFLALSGCSRNNTEGLENSSAQNSTSTSASNETTQDSSLIQTQTEQNHRQTGTMISEIDAKEIALSHSGLTSELVTFIKSGIDWDDEKTKYDVEFYTSNQKEYDYEIDPYTGEVLDYDYDAEYYTFVTDTLERQEITEDRAKQIVLEQVPGAAEQDIRDFKSDYDDARLYYEGKIYYDKMKYEFEIDGYSGEIVEWNVEPIYE